MRILTAKDLLDGKTADKRTYTGLMQPRHMLPKAEKTEEWGKRAVDWYEHLGMQQLSAKYERLIKNYKLAKGIIDKTDYIKEEGNQYGNVISSLLDDEESVDAMSLDNFPIITNVVNVLTGEFSRRNNKLSVEAVDAFTRNEKLDAKYDKVKAYAENKAKQKLITKLLDSGYQIKSEEELQQFQQQVDEQVKSLPEIQQIFKKDYRTTIEQWAQHQLKIDDNRFNMYELENSAFHDYIVTDSQYWHIDLREDDYVVEPWSPINTFSFKSPTEKYVSAGTCAGRILVMTIPEVLDTFGYKMNKEQMESLETSFVASMTPLPAGSRNSDYYDTSRSYNDQEPNSVNLHKLLTGLSNQPNIGNSDKTFFGWLNSSDKHELMRKDLVIVSQIYFKSQQQVGKLTSIDEQGNVMKELVSEDFVVTNHPIYDNLLTKDKTEQNLVYGEHVEWFWINQVYGAVKINTQLQQSFGKRGDGIESIYLDVKPIPFQFNSSGGLWGNKLPVEGFSCTDPRLNKPFSPVDLMKPYQIIYNLVNNQNKDLLIDENGTVILFDQNFLPTSSMGEDWGQNNLAKAYVAMKNFQMLPIDSSMSNLGERNSFSHFQTLNLEQTNRFMSRLKIGEWAKFEAFASIGITPQRLGAVQASESATGTNAAVENSYTQTEFLFVNHTNFLMPRVRTMMIEAAQFYQSSNPMNNLQYTTEDGENIMFAMEGTKLLPRDIQVYTHFRPDTKQLVDGMKRIVFENNTSGATVYDLLKVASLETPSQIVQAAKESVDNFQRQEQEKRAHEQQMLDKQIEAAKQAKLDEQTFMSTENEKDRDASYQEAIVKAMGFSNETDVDTNNIPDVLEIDKFQNSQSEFRQKLELEREKLNTTKETNLRAHMDKKEDRRSKERIADQQLAVAKENQTKAELAARNKKKST